MFGIINIPFIQSFKMLLHAHEDVDTLARHLNATLSDRALAARLAAAGRETVRERFGMDAFAHNVVSLYSDALSGT